MKSHFKTNDSGPARVTPNCFIALAKSSILCLFLFCGAVTGCEPSKASDPHSIKRKAIAEKIEIFALKFEKPWSAHNFSSEYAQFERELDELTASLPEGDKIKEIADAFKSSTQSFVSNFSTAHISLESAKQLGGLRGKFDAREVKEAEQKEDQLASAYKDKLKMILDSLRSASK